MKTDSRTALDPSARAEQKRLEEDERRERNWKRFGPDLVAWARTGARAALPRLHDPEAEISP